MTAAVVVLCAATLLVSLVAGFLFAFAVVVMPGIHELDDGAFLRAFQHMDGVIQRGDPVFGFIFVGSIVSVLAAVVLGAPALVGLDRALLLTAGGVYLVGVVVPTGVTNVPLNNQLQRLDVGAQNAQQLAAARQAFEPRWNRWNRIRTALATGSAALMTTLLVTL